MLAERSLRPLPPSPAHSRPPSPRDPSCSTSRATPSRPLPLPAPQPRSQSASSCRRPLPVPPGETDPFALLRRTSEPSVCTYGDEHATGSVHGPVACPRRGVRPLPTPVTSPLLTPATSPLPTPASTPGVTVTVFINPFEPEPISHRPASTTLSLDDVECFGIRPKHSEHVTGHIVKSKSQDFRKEDGGQVQRRMSSAARKIIARDKEEQDEAWRAFLAKKSSQPNKL